MSEETKDVLPDVPSGFHNAVQEKSGMVLFITPQFFQGLAFCHSVAEENIGHKLLVVLFTKKLPFFRE
jgi:hypothetical protein